MLVQTNYTISLTTIQAALAQLPNMEFRLAINEPTGDFFYDPWKLKDEYVGTVWEELYNSLPVVKGEARIIKLESGECYASHADMDDRYHLNLSGTHCYLIDLDTHNMIKLQSDGHWYNMDAGIRHTAANFGNPTRYQLVVRHLFTKHNLDNPISVEIRSKEYTSHPRFIFDDTISPWLNVANKQAKITNFKFIDNIVSFDIDEKYLSELKSIVPQQLKLIIK